MTANIHSILNDLGSTIEAAISTEKARADAAETKVEAILAGMQAILANIAAPANDDQPDTDPDPAPAVKRAARRKPSRLKLPDIMFLNALEESWLTARQLRLKLAKAGHAISEGGVYVRMREVAASNSNVEVGANPEKWRIANPEVDATAHELVAAKPKKAKQRGGAAHSALAVAVAANENPPATIFPPALLHGDCLERMGDIPDASVDLILADLPYGVSELGIDSRLDLNRLFTEYRRIISRTGNIVLFGQQPFTTALINAAPDIFRHALVWEKEHPTGFCHARAKPLQSHEDILVFSKGANISPRRAIFPAIYNPVGAVEVERSNRKIRDAQYLKCKISGHNREGTYMALTNCPRSVLKFGKARHKGAHPFAKPVPLLEYLIRMYSHEGSTVLDNTMGGGSTMVAAMRTGRRGIGIEMDAHWFATASERVATERDVMLAPGVEFVSVAMGGGNDIQQDVGDTHNTYLGAAA